MALTKIDNQNISADAITSTKISASVSISNIPKITNVSIANSSYTILDDTAVNVGGGYIVVTGSKFATGAQVIVGDVPALSTTYVNSTTLRAQVDSANAATYNLYVVNTDGSTGLKLNGLTYSTQTTWSTSSSLSQQIIDVPFTINLSANSDSNITYSNTTTLPAGTTLLSNGYFYGSVTGIETDTTYNFTVRAIDEENQESDRTFSMTVLISAAPTSVEYLVVAGGGAGAAFSGGGGGGGYLENTLSVTYDTTYTVTVGAGGTGSGFSADTVAATGNDSSFHNVTAKGGGGGANRKSNNTGLNGGTGGSGGGGSAADGAPYGAGGSATTGQGYAGGNGAGGPGTSYGWGGGGGGGAGGVGYNAIDFTGGNGGPGKYSSISGANTAYSGGGGGGSYGGNTAGTGGVGGGGNGTGTSSGNSNPGQTNTGGGGGAGGSFQSGTAGSGGSGIVIIRYADTYDDAVSTTGSPTYTNTGGYKTYKFTGSGSITW
jgi:hypothetical protein